MKILATDLDRTLLPNGSWKADDEAIDLFNERGVNVFVGAPKKGVTVIVDAYLNNTLSFSANYCDH